VAAPSSISSSSCSVSILASSGSQRFETLHQFFAKGRRRSWRCSVVLRHMNRIRAPAWRPSCWAPGMPLHQVQKFLRHKRITTTQIYADTSLRGMSENYLRAFAVKQ
jgi:integrase